MCTGVYCSVLCCCTAPQVPPIPMPPDYKDGITLTFCSVLCCCTAPQVPPIPMPPDYKDGITLTFEAKLTRPRHDLIVLMMKQVGKGGVVLMMKQVGKGRAVLMLTQLCVCVCVS